MAKPSSSKTELTILKSYFWMLLVLWTVLVGSILLWSLFRQKHETEQVARIQARSSFEKDIVYRRWAAGHGGVYVPMTDKTPPNPYLSHIEEREITTPSGRVLTLVNPAYMTRQVHELGLEQYGSRGHVTSLKPIRPANAADEWETKALRAFEQGAKEVSSIEKLDNQNYMRLMRPMITEQSCLKCHAEQGYKVGDLRGGISVSVPMAPIQAVARGHALTLAMGHFLLWLLGAGGISFGGQRLKQRVQERKYAEEQVENLAKFPSENPNPVLRITKDGILLYANSASDSFLTEWSGQVGQLVPENWRQMVSEVFISGSEKRFEIEHAGRTFSFMLVPVLEANYVNIYGRDITDRKQNEQQRERLVEILDAKNKEIERFSSVVRHDFGNPILSIQAFSSELVKTTEQIFELLQGQNIEQKVKDRLLSILKDDVPSSAGFIQNAVNQMIELLEGLKHVAAIGRVAINIEQLDINQLIKEMTGTMKFQIQDCGASLIVEQLPGCLGDAAQIRQIFTNLLTNAIKYLSPDRKGRICISGKVENGESIYCIEDNGIGITPNQQKKVFDVFHRVDPSNPASGEGLGLTIVVKILDRQDGRIWVESELGKGSRFYVALPHLKD